MDSELADIAVTLYTGSPTEFTTARNARAADTDDPALATRIRALKKPSVAAWVVNVFAHERSSQLEEALLLAEELRKAQADLDARALAQLGRDRRALTNRLAADAAELAEARGQRITASTREAVQQTISAAFFDPTAAAAVASARLVRELEPAGTFADIADSIVGGALPTPPRSPPSLSMRSRRAESGGMRNGPSERRRGRTIVCCARRPQRTGRSGMHPCVSTSSHIASRNSRQNWRRCGAMRNVHEVRPRRRRPSRKHSRSAYETRRTISAPHGKPSTGSPTPDVSL